MIRRTCALLALAGAVSLTVAAPAPANHTLAHKVQLLTQKLNCLQRYPVFAFGDYAYYDLSNASVPVTTAETSPRTVDVLLHNGDVTALDFNYGTGAPPSDAFFLGIKNTAGCRAKFPLAPNPVSFARTATTAKMLRLQ